MGYHIEFLLLFLIAKLYVVLLICNFFEWEVIVCWRSAGFV